MSLPRVFLAVPLPLHIRESICTLQENLRTRMPDVRWTRPDNLHLTLHFFGETTQETLEKIKVSVLSVKRCQQPFMVEVKGLGAFPDWHRPRILWLILEPEDAVRKLHGDCQQALHLAGVVTESRPYTPHLTIGRLRQNKTDLTGLPGSVGLLPVGWMQIDSLALFESRLHSNGAEHVPLLTLTFDDEIDSL